MTLAVTLPGSDLPLRSPPTRNPNQDRGPVATLRRAHPICCWALERTRPLGSPMKLSRVHAAFPGSCRHGRGRSSGPRHDTDELKNSTPGGRRPTLGTACCRIPLRRMSGTGRATETGSTAVVGRSCGHRGFESVPVGMGVSFWGRRECPHTGCDGNHTTPRTH